jgi:ribosomal protein S18 acetylase RimI-like enzyme
MTQVTPFSQACTALVASLIGDPFYWAITEDFGTNLAQREQALTCYFEYSLGEAQRTGRSVLAPDPRLGAAAWLLPRTPDVDAKESKVKSEYLTSIFGPRGNENYYRMVGYMAPLAARVVPNDAWYLSIIGVLPSAQGQGIGARLVAGTLAEASSAHVSCYLETFTSRNLRFYEPLGFSRVAEHIEPTTGKTYVVMRRDA